MVEHVRWVVTVKNLATYVGCPALLLGVSAWKFGWPVVSTEFFLAVMVMVVLSLALFAVTWVEGDL